MSSERERQMKKAKYDYCKAKGICVICCKEPAFYNRVRCPSCIEKAAEQKAKRTANLTTEQRDHINQTKRTRYWRYRENGLCANCGRKAVEGKSLCNVCFIQQRRAGAAYRERSGKKKGWSEAGLCLFCGGERVEGKMLCKTCLEKNRDLMAYARQFAPKDRPWERL